VKNSRSRHVRNRTSGPDCPETPDRRVQRTRTSLRNALISLAREKPYGSIAVKEILARANVGRSTFYMHFHDKDELLDCGIYEMLGSIRRRSSSGAGLDQVIAFSRPILEYIAAHRRPDGPSMPHQGRLIMHDRLEDVLTHRITEDLAMVMRRRQSAPAMPTDLLARHVAATFVLVLNWWVDSEVMLTPAEADGRFRALVLPILTML
jgi:AcrR family transcriptional regulator